MRLLILAPYPLRSAPSQRFRFEQYLDRLPKYGITADVRPLLGGDADPSRARTLGRLSTAVKGALRRLEDILRAGSYDAVLVHREAFPAGPPLIERAIHSRGVPLIFDFDDALYLRNVSDENRHLAWMKAPSKVPRIVEMSDLVIAGNPVLAEWSGARTANVRIIPTTIDTDLYRPLMRGERETVCIGWSGSRTTIQHLDAVADVLRAVQTEHGVRLKAIGDSRYSIPGADVSASDWSEDSELSDLSEIDIGIMPLPDEEWARGKCGLKALQYMALGIPTVMSPVGVNGEIASDGAALLAADRDEWHQVLVDLVTDASRRRSVGEAGRRRVLERYSTDANEEALAAALKSVL